MKPKTLTFKSWHEYCGVTRKEGMSPRACQKKVKKNRCAQSSSFNAGPQMLVAPVLAASGNRDVKWRSWWEVATEKVECWARNMTAAVPPGDCEKQPISQPGATERNVLGSGVRDRSGLGVLDTQGEKEPKCQGGSWAPPFLALHIMPWTCPFAALLTVSLSPQHCWGPRLGAQHLWP